MSNHKFLSLMIYLSIFFIFMACIIMTVSCSSKDRRLDDNPVPIPDITKPISETGEISKDIKDSADSIDESVDAINKVTPEDLKPQIEPHTEAIHGETNNLRDQSEKLLSLQKELEAQQSKIEELTKHATSLEGNREKLKKEIEDLKSENNRLLKKMLAWLAAACVAGIGICVFIVFLTQNKIAIFGAIGCAITMCVAVAVSAYMIWIAYITAGVFVALSIIAGLYVWKQIKSKKKEIIETKSETATYSKALQEVVQTGELAKKYMSTEARQHVFGDGPELGQADAIQNEKTKILVKKLRESNVKLAPSVPSLFRKEKVTI